jgi:hypothetical protein
VKEKTEGDLAELHFTEAQYLLYTFRFSKPEKLRFEDQIETFPYSSRGAVLARYPRS